MLDSAPSRLEAPRTATARAETREALVELWAQIFEVELRADLEPDKRALPMEPADAAGPSTAGGA